MKRYAVSILFQEQTYSGMRNSLRMGIVDATSRESAIGKFLLMKRKDEDLRNSSSSIELVIEILENEPGNDPEI